jgi:hypothetical protein
MSKFEDLSQVPNLPKTLNIEARKEEYESWLLVVAEILERRGAIIDIDKLSCSTYRAFRNGNPISEGNLFPPLPFGENGMQSLSPDSLEYKKIMEDMFLKIQIFLEYLGKDTRKELQPTDIYNFLVKEEQKKINDQIQKNSMSSPNTLETVESELITFMQRNNIPQIQKLQHAFFAKDERNNKGEKEELSSEQREPKFYPRTLLLIQILLKKGIPSEKIKFLEENADEENRMGNYRILFVEEFDAAVLVCDLRDNATYIACGINRFLQYKQNLEQAGEKMTKKGLHKKGFIVKIIWQKKGEQEWEKKIDLCFEHFQPIRIEKKNKKVMKICEALQLYILLGKKLETFNTPTTPVQKVKNHIYSIILSYRQGREFPPEARQIIEENGITFPPLRERVILNTLQSVDNLLKRQKKYSEAKKSGEKELIQIYGSKRKAELERRIIHQRIYLFRVSIREGKISPEVQKALEEGGINTAKKVHPLNTETFISLYTAWKNGENIDPKEEKRMKQLMYKYNELQTLGTLRKSIRKKLESIDYDFSGDEVWRLKIRKLLWELHRFFEEKGRFPKTITGEKTFYNRLIWMQSKMKKFDFSSLLPQNIFTMLKNNLKTFEEKKTKRGRRKKEE